MREEEVIVLSDKEEEFVELLTMAGMKRNPAIVLVRLAQVWQATSREIEHRTGLRQPEVSIAIKELIGRGWVIIRMLSHGKGRPVKNYSLALPFAEILSVIEQDMKKSMISRINMIQKLKHEAGSVSG